MASFLQLLSTFPMKHLYLFIYFDRQIDGLTSTTKDGGCNAHTLEVYIEHPKRKKKARMIEERRLQAS